MLYLWHFWFNIIILILTYHIGLDALWMCLIIDLIANVDIEELSSELRCLIRTFFDLSILISYSSHVLGNSMFVNVWVFRETLPGDAM